MANWCSNTVHFECSDNIQEQLKVFFNAMAQKAEREGCGQLPDFVKEQDGWLFNIYWDSGGLYYDTKWCPNVAIIKAVADRFGAGFTYSYDELGSLVYGEYTYREAVLTDVFLGQEDFDSYDYREEEEDYIFEGESYESDYEILDILLERKKTVNSIHSTANSNTN